MSEDNNEIWIMRSARLDQQATIQKLLKEGFEPFWGTTVTVDKKGVKEKVIKMYFRKPPTFVLAAVEEPLAKFDMGPVEEFSNQLRSALSGVLDTFLDSFFTKLDEWEVKLKPALEWHPEPDHERSRGHVVKELGTDHEIVLNENKTDEEDEPVYDENTGRPRGDDFRVVDDVPELAIAAPQRTDAQNSTLTQLRSQGNITVLPGLTENGEVRVMIGADRYTIERNGNFTVENTGARTDSTIVGG